YGRSEAHMAVVVHHTYVLHERVHTRGPDEAVPLRLQLLGERVGLWRRLREVRDGPWRTLAGGLIRFGERDKARRCGRHRPRVVDGRLDLATVTDDRRVLQQPVDISTCHRRNLGDVEAVEGSPETVTLAEHDRPAEPDLEHPERQ